MGYFVRLGRYYVGLIFVIFIATLTTTLTLTLQLQGNAEKPVPAAIRSLFFDKFAKYFLIRVNLPPIATDYQEPNEANVFFLAQCTNAN